MIDLLKLRPADREAVDELTKYLKGNEYSTKLHGSAVGGNMDYNDIDIRAVGSGKKRFLKICEHILKERPIGSFEYTSSLKPFNQDGDDPMGFEFARFYMLPNDNIKNKKAVIDLILVAEHKKGDVHSLGRAFDYYITEGYDLSDTVNRYISDRY